MSRSPKSLLLMQLWLIKQVSMTLHDRWNGLTTVLLLLFSDRDEVIVINVPPRAPGNGWWWTEANICGAPHPHSQHLVKPLFSSLLLRTFLGLKLDIVCCFFALSIILSLRYSAVLHCHTAERKLLGSALHFYFIYMWIRCELVQAYIFDH